MPERIIRDMLAKMTDGFRVFQSQDPQELKEHMLRDHGFYSQYELARVSPDAHFRLLWCFNSNYNTVHHELTGIFDPIALAHEFNEVKQNVSMFRRLSTGCTPEKVKNLIEPKFLV